MHLSDNQDIHTLATSSHDTTAKVQYRYRVFTEMLLVTTWSQDPLKIPHLNEAESNNTISQLQAGESCLFVARVFHVTFPNLVDNQGSELLHPVMGHIVYRTGQQQHPLQNTTSCAMLDSQFVASFLQPNIVNNDVVGVGHTVYGLNYDRDVLGSVISLGFCCVVQVTGRMHLHRWHRKHYAPYCMQEVDRFCCVRVMMWAVSSQTGRTGECLYRAI